MRRFGQSSNKGQTYTDRPGAYAIILTKEGVLLTHQQDPIPEFQLPGGGIDPGESVLCALHREVMEETGWRIEPIKRLGIHQRYVYMPEYKLHARKICHIYLARGIRPLGPPTEAGHMALEVDPEIAPKLIENDGDRWMFNEL